MKFKLRVENGVATLPNTMGVENVKERLLNKRGGFKHVVAYTNAKPLKRARELGLDLVKITDIMVVMGKHKKEENTAQNEAVNGNEVTNNNRVIWFESVSDNKGRNFYLSRHIENGTEYFRGQTTKNRKHVAKSYYVDRNSGLVFEKEYLIENRIISSARSNASDYIQFNLENIISI